MSSAFTSTSRSRHAVTRAGHVGHVYARHTWQAAVAARQDRMAFACEGTVGIKRQPRPTNIDEGVAPDS